MKKLEKHHNEIIEKLDFFGGKNSYFDFWHIHYDFDGEGNESLGVRKKYLREGIRIYNLLETKLKNYPYEFQLWIGIDETNSGDDGVYIHTRSPNSSYFPHNVKDEIIEVNDLELYDFLRESDFEIIRSKNDDTNYFYLYKSRVGVSFENKTNVG